MRQLTTLTLPLLVVAVLHGQGGRPVPAGLAPYISVTAPVVALTHVRLVDGSGTPAVADHTVVLSGARIDAVGPSATTSIPAGAQILDLAGHTVLPGLVSLHEHTYFAGVRRMTQMRQSGPLLYLAYGVTTAMTAGSQLPYQELHLKQSVDAGATPGPRFLITGPYLDGETSRGSMNRKITTREEARRVMSVLGERGRHVGKIPGPHLTCAAARGDRRGARARTPGDGTSLLGDLHRGGRDGHRRLAAWLHHQQRLRPWQAA